MTNPKKENTNDIFIKADQLTVSYPVLNAKVTQLNAKKSPEEKTGWGQIIPGRNPHVLALDNISFDISGSERVAILGRNGAGKSTLLQTLGGVITPNSGTLKIQGNSSGIYNLRQGLKMESTGRRNILLRGLILGKSKAEIDEKIETIEKFSELGDYLDLPISTYSSGMIIRLMFSVITAFDPDILIVDEWIGSVDAPFKDKALNWVLEYTQQNRIFVLSSHNLSFVKKACDRGLLLQHGKVIADGPIEDVIKAYKASNA